LVRELSRQLMLPEAHLRIHPVPSLSDLVFDSLPSVLYEVLAGEVADEEAQADAVWEPLPCGVAVAEPVVLWVTATLQSTAQVLRVSKLVGAGLAPSVDVAPMLLPFTMRNSVCEARLEMLDFGWPMTMLNDAAFLNVDCALGEAVERLVERSIPLDRVVAELRFDALVNADYPFSFFIELLDRDNGVVLARVPGMDARWVNAYVPYFCDAVEALGLHNATTRMAPHDPLEYFFA
jgi:hypothetical protein